MARTHGCSGALVTVAALAVGLALGLTAGAPAALAADLDPILRYQGSGTTTSDLADYTVALELAVDCSDTPCMFDGTVAADGVTYPLLPAPAPVIDGHLEVPIAASGDPCGDDYINAGSLTIDVTAGALTGTRIADGTEEIQCSDGSVLYHAGVLRFEATLVSGDDCLVLGECSSTPTPAPDVAIAPVAVSGSDPNGTEPGTLSTLQTAGEALRPANVLWAAAGALVLVILIALPSHLLTTALEGASDRLAERLARGRAIGRTLGRALTGWPAAAGAVGVAAVISAFIDPEFGPSLHGLRVLASVAVSFAVEVVLGWTILVLLVRRTRPGAAIGYKVIPLGLLAVVAAVLFSRLTGFEPGLVYGVVAAVVVAGLASIPERARLTLLTLGYAFGIGLIAWIGYSVLPDTGTSAVIVFVRETLSALAIGGIVALPIALLPVPGLAGADVFRWRRPVWLAAYGVGLAAFLLVLMPLPASWDTVPVALPVWIGVVAVYAVAATGAWLALARPWAHGTSAEAAED